MRILIAIPDLGMQPVGLAYISAVVKKAGHEVDCIDKYHIEGLDAALGRKEYDFLLTGGLSVNYRALKGIIEVAQRRRTRVILGGGIVTSEPELIHRALQADFSVLGEGEETVVELLSCLAEGGDPEKVAGIGFLREGAFVRTAERKAILDLDSLPFPDWEVTGFAIDLDRARPSDGYLTDLFDHPRLYPIIASRSCPYLCTFCYHPLGNKYRQRSIDSVMEEIALMVPRYRINILSIFDELFSYNKERVSEFCRKFTAFKSTLSWDVKWNCQMRVDQTDQEMLEMMKASGCHLVSYGFESYSAPVLKSMQKHIAPEGIHRAIHATLEKGISIQANFIFGDVAETAETAKETLDFWKEHAFAGINLGFILPCPGSQMYHHCLDNGIIGDKLDFIENRIYHIYNMTRMSDAEFQMLRQEVLTASLEHHVKAVPLSYRDDTLTIRCPHCSDTVEYRNFALSGVVVGKPPGIPAGKHFFCQNVNCRSCHKRFYAVSRLYLAYSKIFPLLARLLLFRSYLKVKTFFRSLSGGAARAADTPSS